MTNAATPELSTRIRQLIADTLNVATEAITDDSRLTDVLGPRYDSLSALQVVTAVESEFDVEVDFVADDVRLAFSSIAHIADFVAARLEDAQALGRTR